ncbi:DUF3564 family protein [Trinickia mobilis]|uniref:DUF3564 family protein n=1 Tax=Trinickia mobilis TaxID=2816356 RepID=UPI001A8CAADE|nr:DUF3564 family protein [Trinickia mobilis]
MRLSILVNCSDPTFCHDYALLWLDTMSRKWSRQSSSGIELPQTGETQITGAVTLLHAAGNETALITLHDLQVDVRGRLSATQGAASWLSATRLAPISGFWRLQAIERPPATPPGANPNPRAAGHPR